MTGKSTVTLHALSAGNLTLSEKFFITPSDPDAKFSVPSLCFLIQHTSHSGKVTRIVFDLGLRRDLSLYPEPLQRHCETRQPLSTDPDVVKSLSMGDLTVDDIDYVILSHVHYDHVGMPSDFSNTKTKFIIGPGASELLSGKTTLDIGSHSVFEPDLLPQDRTIELSSPDSNQPNPSYAKWKWAPFSVFPSTVDLFNDGSIFIVNAPGHLPGHINLLVPDGGGNNKAVYLAGDACHDMRLFTGERDIATWTDAATGRYCCIHADIPAALDTLARLRKLAASSGSGREREEGKESGFEEVEIIFAHNWMWERDARARGRFWPGKL